jgi:polyphosphate kinase 2 (PPK2 family)
VFRTAELGRKVSKQEFQARERVLRQDLLEAENVLRQADFPVIVLFGGVDGAGKGDLVNALNVWMDPRWLVTRAFDDPSQEDEERPEYWRFWRELPPKGSVGLLLSAWYSRPLLRRAHGGSAAEFDEALDDIVAFEKQLADDGALIIKFWLHLGKKAQEKRFKSLEKDPLQNWRVTETDWENWRNYDRFIAAAERIIVRTSTGEAPWHIVEGADSRYSSLRVGDLLLEAIQRQLTDQAAARPTLTENGEASGCREKSPSGPAEDATREAQTRRSRPLTVLAALDTTQRLAKIEYRKLLATYQGQLNQLQRRARGEQVSTILVFEGWDAAGKGGAIRRINAALDSRALRVIPIAAPTDEERAHASGSRDHLRPQLVRPGAGGAGGGVRRRSRMAPRLRGDQPLRAAAGEPRYRAPQVLDAHQPRRAAPPLPGERADPLQALEAHGRGLEEPRALGGLRDRRPRHG